MKEYLDITLLVWGLVGGLFTWSNVVTYARQRTLKGWNWYSTAYAVSLGMLHCLNFVAVQQWLALWGAIFTVSGNLAWLCWVLFDKIMGKLAVEQ